MMVRQTVGTEEIQLVVGKEYVMVRQLVEGTVCDDQTVEGKDST